MPSPSGAFGWLLAKEWRELLAARSWWVFLALMGPLVGFSFIDAVRTYAELSGLNGTAAGVGEAFSPLIGVWAPTFSGGELAATFLLPFVAIALVGGGRQSGADVLEAQQHLSPAARIAAKALVLAAGWLIASVAPLIAILLWTMYGGHVDAIELSAVALGHVLNAGLIVALAAAAAAVTEHPSTAAIATLAVTVGTWMLNFAAAVHGGMWEKAAAYTPTAMVAEFQRGLVRLDTLLVAVVFMAALFGIAAIWLRLDAHVSRRIRASMAILAIAGGLAWTATHMPGSWDLSENRGNSFTAADERALRSIPTALSVEAHLAPEDPRRSDLERRVLSKLRRTMRRVDVEYVSATSIGLFEQSDPRYGEIRFALDGRTAVTRATTAEGVLETIYTLARVSPPSIDEDEVFRGYPLPAPPRGAAALFYGVWPALAAGAALAWRKWG